MKRKRSTDSNENEIVEPSQSSCLPLPSLSCQLYATCDNVHYTVRPSAIPGSYSDGTFPNHALSGLGSITKRLAIHEVVRLSSHPRKSWHRCLFDSNYFQTRGFVSKITKHWTGRADTFQWKVSSLATQAIEMEVVFTTDTTPVCHLYVYPRLSCMFFAQDICNDLQRPLTRTSITEWIDNFSAARSNDSRIRQWTANGMDISDVAAACMRACHDMEQCIQQWDKQDTQRQFLQAELHISISVYTLCILIADYVFDWDRVDSYVTDLVREELSMHLNVLTGSVHMVADYLEGTTLSSVFVPYL